MLARHLADKLHARLREAGDGASRLTAIEMEVEESVGQSAVYRILLGADAPQETGRKSARNSGSPAAMGGGDR
jgi:hypothetical protein